MKWLWLVILICDFGKMCYADDDGGKYTEEEARGFMDNLNKVLSIWGNRMQNAEWDYASNLTDYNLQKKLEISSELAAFYKEQWKELIKYPWQTFNDPSLKRQFKIYSTLGIAALPKEKRSRLDQIVAEMSDIYSTTKLYEWRGRGEPPSEEPTMSLEPDLTLFFANNVTEICKLQYYWEGWHSSVGRREKRLFEEYVNLTNEAAKLNNFTDNAALWNDEFEMENFDEAIHKLYQQILPFYQHLHAYVRRKLSQVHNTNHRLIRKHGCLPAHILGNMWTQHWQHVYNLTAPYPDKTSVDVTPTMKEKNYTPLTLFKISEEFYTSINLSAMTDTFWKKSIIEKPEDRDIICHASAWEFDDGNDYRIKMCTRVNMEDFKTIHHEMGHIEYFMQYKDQPKAFREGANSGFHEAVGDTVALSVSTPDHLIKIGLLNASTYVKDDKAEINSLFLTALEKVAFLPFAYVLDLWRWEIFRGNITAKEYNCRYWQLRVVDLLVELWLGKGVRTQYSEYIDPRTASPWDNGWRHDLYMIRQELQGIVPPAHRSTEEFDPGAKYHVIADVPYIRYFISFIIQFQFHKALCIKAGQYNPEDPSSKPLHHCDIYQSKEAGNLFREMLQMGSSKPWQDAMELITGQRDMDAGPLLEYFKPLHDWLANENNRTKERVGWSTKPKIDCRHNGQVRSTLKGLNTKCHYFPGGPKGSKEKNKKE